ncbi:MAG: phosphomannomutase/phosphoglucomutase [Chromatiaceae bacterium]|nr:phosphomannomutase/phosphoglucomutase [Chromatiaceae bacterium]
MRLFKKKSEQAPTPRPAARGGRSLIVYFLPTFVVAVLLMLLVAVLARQGIRNAATELARSTAASVAGALATRLEGEVVARRSLINLALADGRAAEALASRDAEAIRAAEAELQKGMPGLLQLRLLLPDANQPDPSGVAPLGYAGLDMLRQTLGSGRPASAEIHQIKTGTPYLALALPVQAEGRNAGVLFAAWDMRPIASVVANSPTFPGRLQLLQGGEAGYVLAEGPGPAAAAANQGAVDVPETIWTVSYGISPQNTGLGDTAMLLAVVGGGALALLLTLFLQWRILGRDLRADMGTLVDLGESILRREGAAARQAYLASSGDAIALLGQYARDARNGGGAAGAPVVPKASAAASTTGDVRPMGIGVEVEELDGDAAGFLDGGRTLSRIDVPEVLFRAYDVRGLVGESLTAEIAQLLGQAMGSLVQEQGGHRVAVAGDARQSSPELSAALIRGLLNSGCDVLDIGQAPTPLLYFAMATQPVQAAVMVTGSHNPSNYNGFKIVIGDRVLDGDELQALRRRMIEGAFSRGKGVVERQDLVGAYVEAVLQEVQLARPLKVVVDAGNGVAGDLAIATFEALGCEVIPLFCEPDGSFPNHHPDPSQPDNLASLMLEVQAQQADIGFAFDGDGDRLGVVDDNGGAVWSDTVLMLLAADVLGRHPGVDVLYDVKSSRHLASFILSHGGRPIMWKSGHSRMRAKMLETGALLGGEFSGHLFIKERWFGFDDAVYAATRVLELLALDPRGANEVFADLPSSPATPEYQLPLEEGQSASLMRALDAHKVFDDARLVELDGLRVEFANGWGLIRPSNTTPSLIFRFEADDEGALEQIKARFRDLLRRVAPDMQAPF